MHKYTEMMHGFTPTVASLLSCLLTIAIKLTPITCQTSCETSQSCISSNIALATTTVQCQGFASCENASISTNGSKIECDGSYSCYSSRLMQTFSTTFSSDIQCRGLFSCANSKSIKIKYGGLNCNGEQSCINSMIEHDSSVVNVHCSGDRSCANSRITPSGNIRMYGNLAAYNTTFYGNNTSLNKYTFNGFESGRNTTIICGSGRTCQVDCYGRGCKGLTLICEGEGDNNGNDCTFSMNTCDRAEYDPVNCPNGFVIPWYDLDINESVAIPSLLDNSKYNYLSSINNSRNLCENSGNPNCNDKSECASQTVVGGPVCCTANLGCRVAENITSMIGSDTQDYGVAIRCDAYDACAVWDNRFMLAQDGTYGAGNVYGTAEYGITGGNGYRGIVRTSGDYDIICSGLSGCSNVYLKNAKNLYGTGDYCGRDVQLVSNIENVYAYGRMAFYSVLFVNIDNLFIHGDKACDQAIIRNVFNNIYINGDNGLAFANVSNVKISIYAMGYEALLQSDVFNVSNVYCLAKESCEHSTLIGIHNKIYAFGENALRYSTIISNSNFDNNGNLVVHINGTNNDDFDIYCNVTDICIIKCQSTDACTNLNLHCGGNSSSTSRCYVSCDDAGGINCPQSGYYQSLSPTNSPTIDPTNIPTSYPTNILSATCAELMASYAPYTLSSGVYTITSASLGSSLEMYCDFDYENNNGWTLITSGARDTLRGTLRRVGFSTSHEVAVDDVNTGRFDQYRISYDWMNYLQTNSDYLLASCEFNTSFAQDWVLFNTTQFDILTWDVSDESVCTPMVSVNINGNTCSSGNISIVQLTDMHPHLSVQSHCGCSSSLSLNEETDHDYWGAYWTWDTSFTCTQNKTSTTQWWYGSKVTAYPTESPTEYPTAYPTGTTINPTAAPTDLPSVGPTSIPSIPPTLYPTSVPVISPSNSPSAAPSPTPTINPSGIPTQVPSTPSTSPSIPPSTYPSNSPSNSPSYFPSTTPSISPSYSPSHSPSHLPSSSPSISPSSSPSTVPSSVPTINASDTSSNNNTNILGDDKNEDEYNDDDISINVGEWEFGTLFFIIGSLLAPKFAVLLHKYCDCIYAPRVSKIKHTLDGVNWLSIEKSFFNFGDFFSDLIFSMFLLFDNYYLKYYALFFTLMPHLLSNIIAMYWMHYVRTHIIYTSKYVNSYDWMIVITSVFFGFYTSIELCQSRLFYLDMFNLQFKKEIGKKLYKFRFVNSVILENLPQVIIQIMHINDHGIDMISFISMIFSFTSIMHHVFLSLSRWTRSDSNSSSSSSSSSSNLSIFKYNFKFQISHPEITKYHKFTHKKLSKLFGKVFGIDYDNVEVYYIYSYRNCIAGYVEFRQNFNNFKLIDNILLCNYNGTNNNNDDDNNSGRISYSSSLNIEFKESICQLFEFENVNNMFVEFIYNAKKLEVSRNSTIDVEATKAQMAIGKVHAITAGSPIGSISPSQSVIMSGHAYHQDRNSFNSFNSMQSFNSFNSIVMKQEDIISVDVNNDGVDDENENEDIANDGDIVEDYYYEARKLPDPLPQVVTPRIPSGNFSKSETQVEGAQQTGAGVEAEAEPEPANAFQGENVAIEKAQIEKEKEKDKDKDKEKKAPGEGENNMTGDGVDFME